MSDFSHLSEDHEGQMVDVSAKKASSRLARARGQVIVDENCAARLDESMLKEIITTARIASVNAAKQTATLIPYCHQVPLSHVETKIEFIRKENKFDIMVETQTVAATGVEMEAFVATQIAAATIYDMIKAQDPGAILGPFSLTYKKGGKLGEWTPLASKHHHLL